MSLKVKRIVSIMLVAAFAIAMLASCNVEKQGETVVLKVAGTKYTLNDYAEIFANEITSYTNGIEATYCPNYKQLSSDERLSKFQEYVYDKLVERAMADYLVEKYELAKKLTDDDKKAIDELVEEALKANASSYESDVKESSTTADELKQSYTLTAEEKTKVDETVEKTIASAIAAKKATSNKNDAKDSDTAASDIALSDDTAASDKATEAMTDDEAKKLVAEEAGCKTFEEYEKQVREDAEFDVLFDYYKADKAMELYKSSFADKETDFATTKKDIEEAKTKEYLRDTKLKDYLVGDYKASDDEAKKFFDDKMKEYKDMAEAKVATDYYKYLNDALQNEEESVWYIADGYYYVKHVLIEKAKDDSKKSDSAKSDATASDEVQVDPEVKAKVEEGIEAINAETNVAKKLAQFDKLIEEYGSDPGLQKEPAKTNGYLMGNGNSMVEEFANAAEKLYNGGKGNIGDISEGISTTYGIHYIQLVKKVEPKEVKFDDIKDEVVKSATEANINVKLEEKIKLEKKDVKIVEYPARIKSYGSQFAQYYFNENNNIGING